LGALGEEQDGEKHRKGEAHEDGDSEDFHAALKKAETVQRCSADIALGCTDLVDNFP
jgi:hypothetical protein